jgi:hypothetical protein
VSQTIEEFLSKIEPFLINKGFEKQVFSAGGVCFWPAKGLPIRYVLIEKNPDDDETWRWMASMETGEEIFGDEHRYSWCITYQKRDNGYKSLKQEEML